MIFNGTGLQKDSGAIVVGAGVPPTNHVDFDGFGPSLPAYTSLGVPRSRIWFSNAQPAPGDEASVTRGDVG